MKQPIRLFSIGVFATSVIVLVFYFFDDSKAKSKEMNTDEMIAAIEEDGYRVVTESEYISLSVDDKNDKKAEQQTTDKQNETSTTEPKEDAASEDKKEEKPATDETDKSYTLKIESGMASSTISSLLADNGIIEDANEFTNYLEDEGYSTKIQLGEFELSSSMSNYEIAEELTK